MIRLLISILAHVFGDFVFQSDKSVEERFSEDKKNRIKATLKHVGMIVLILFLGITPFYKFDINVFKYIILIGISHFIIDIIKSEIEIRSKENKEIISLITFLIDQFIHISVIFICWYMLACKFSLNKLSQYLISEFGNGKLVLILNLQSIFQNSELKTIIIECLIFIIVSIYVCLAGAIVVKKIIDIGCKGKLQDKNQGEAQVEAQGLAQEQVAATCGLSVNENKSGAGKHIGMLERIIVMILVMNNAFTSLAFIIAAKSMARSKKLQEDDDFQEKYLIGTLASILIAIIGGCVCKSLRGM